MKKIRTIIVSAFLIMLLAVTAVVPSYLNTDMSLATRDVDVDNIGTLSYNEKVEELLSSFTSYSATTEDNVAYFEAEQELDLNAISMLSFVSSTEDPVTVKYKTKLDLENEKFYIVTDYYQNGELIESQLTETEPVYEEYADDYYIVMPDGSEVSVKDTLATENLNECVALTMTATAAYAAVMLLAATVVVCAPTIIQTVTTVITAVVSWVKSFLSWFRSLFTKKTTYVTTTTVTTTATPSISIAGTKYQTKTVTKDDVKYLDVNMYFLAFADPTNGKMYISILDIDYNTALMIMMTPILVPCIGNSNKDMIASVLTVNQFLAFELASAAGIAKPTPENHGADYYWHYHSIYEVRTRQGNYARPHVFFNTFTL